MNKRMIVTIQGASVLLALLLAGVAALNILEYITGEEAWNTLMKCFGVWCVFTLAALIIAMIVKPKDEKK